MHLYNGRLSGFRNKASRTNKRPCIIIAPVKVIHFHCTVVMVVVKTRLLETNQHVRVVLRVELGMLHQNEPYRSP